MQVTLPVGLTSIGSEAFLRCFALDSLDIPDAVTVIGDSAFDGNLTLFVGENTEAHRYALAKGLVYWLRDQTLVPAEAITAEKASLTLLKGVAYTLPKYIQPQKNEIMPLATTSIDLEIVIPSEVIQRKTSII